MALRNHPLEALQQFIPDNTFDDLIVFINQYRIKLSIKKDRATVYGDYRPAMNGLPHRISVNGGLNKYHFLITLVHEIAHLVTFEKYGRKVKAHGIEWKNSFKELLSVFIAKKVFPEDVLEALSKSINNLKATSCSDNTLALALRNYDQRKKGILVQDLPMGTRFIAKNGKIFELLGKRRTRFEAKDINNGDIYLFPGLYEVEKRLEIKG
jgi:SprT protein